MEGTVSMATRYQKLEKVGQGTYGVVYKARDKQKDVVVALKKVMFEDDDEGVPATTIREIATLREICRHPNVVSMYDVVMDRGKLFLAFEYMEWDLKRYTEEHGCLRNDLAMSYLFQLLEALDFMHQRRVLHRDVKPSNLLLDMKGVLKLADFGLSRPFSVPSRLYTPQNVVTLWYRAPEILLGDQRYGTKVDMWSVGCVFYEMLVGKPLFVTDSEIDLLHKIFGLCGTPNNENWPDAALLPNWNRPKFPSYAPSDLEQHLQGHVTPAGINLLKRMLTMDPNDRISARDALQHEYFGSLREFR